ncbi:MAG: hypothetical protein V3U78_00705, partial [Thiotrichaceae bacterium]
ARKRLNMLESQSAPAPSMGETLPLALGFPTDTDETAEAIKKAVSAIDPDDLTPRKALEALYQLKKLLSVDS